MDSTVAATILPVVCAASFFVGLGSTPLWDPDEPRFAAATRDMIATGNALAPSFNGAPRFEKPILFYWLQLPFFAALGPTETAARLPSALAGLGCIVLLFLIGRSFFSQRAALLAALALTTVFRFAAYARQGLTDVPAMFFEMAALYGFVRAMHDSSRPSRYAMAGWTAVGLSAATKGPVAIIPVVVWAAYLVAQRGSAGVARWHLAGGLLMACAVWLPWYALMAAVHGRTFLDVAVGQELVQRVVDSPHGRNLFYYIRVWPADALPWTILFVLGCAHAASAWRTLDATVQRGLVLCAVWFATVFVLFSLPNGKLPHYLLPLYAPLSLVAGFYVDRVAIGASPMRPWRYAAAVTGGALLVLAFVSARFLNRAIGATALDPGMLLPGILTAGGLAVVGIGAVRARPVAGTLVLVATLAATYAFLTSYTLPRQLNGLYPGAQLGRILATLVTPGDRLGMYGVVPLSTLVFYSQHMVEPLRTESDVLRFLEGEGRAFCVVAQRHVPRLRQQSRTALYEIARQPKLVARFNRLFGPESFNVNDGDLVVLANQPVKPSP